MFLKKTKVALLAFLLLLYPSPSLPQPLVKVCSFCRV